MERNRNDEEKKQDSWSEWIPIIILLLIPSPWTWVIAFVWMVNKLKGSKKQKVKKHPYDIQKERQGAVKDVQWDTFHAAKTAGSKRATVHTGGGNSRVRPVGAPSQRPPRKKIDSGGTGLIVGGAITSAIFAMGLMGAASDLVFSLQYGSSLFFDDLVGVLFMLVFLGGGLGMLFSGIGKRRRSERCAAYLAYIGANREVELGRMAVNMDVSMKRLVKDLRYMLSKGMLPAGYIDLADGKLYLTEMGYQAKTTVYTEEPPPQKESEDAILREIRQINDEIPGEVMSAKIDRIEEITGRILTYQKNHPDRAGQLRPFLNYYLPTTVKILRAYAQLDAQGVEGENITAAKTRIEGMMDQVVAGFEKQLDKLFQGDALDITSDVEVLENMLRSDGLSGGSGITLEL